MSLQVWLPLNGDLRNQGLSNITVANNGATVNNNGKIGKCYSFDGTNDYIRLYPSVFSNSTTEFSYACWFKPSTTASGCLFSCRTGTNSSGLSIFVNNSGNILFDCGGTRITYSLALTTGVWHHLAFTYKKNEQRIIYLNGTAIYTSNTTGNMTTVSANNMFIGCSLSTDNQADGNLLAGCLNDVRIYDHTISTKEVEEIAKGLVLHYKLDTNLNVLNNCYDYPTFNISSSNGGWQHWGASGHAGGYGQNTNKSYIFNSNQIYSHWFTNGSSATKDYLLYLSPAFNGGYRSLLAIIKEENSLPITENIVYPAWNSRNGGVPLNYWTSIISLGNGFYLCKCEGISLSGSDDLMGIYIKPGYKVYVSEAYVENNREICSDIFNQNNLITIYDSSGYGNNGTIIGSLTTVASSPRYSVATNFNGTNAAILVPNLTPEAVTISFWMKRNADTGTRQFMYTAWYGITCELTTNGAPAFVVNKSGSPVITGNAITVISGWVHYCATFDTTNGMRLYLNGVLVASNSNTAAIVYNITTNYIGKYFSNYYNGLLSDFRIYATALTPEQVKELYNTSMSIDNNGNIHARELVEL